MRAPPSRKRLGGERKPDAVAAEEVGVLARRGQLARQQHAQAADLAHLYRVGEGIEGRCGVLIRHPNSRSAGLERDPDCRVLLATVTVRHRVAEELLKHTFEPQAALARKGG